MMTIDEMIAVLQAYKEGKQIQVKFFDGRGKWTNISGTPLWDFSTNYYRVSTDYRPFETVEEVDAAIKEHGNFLVWKYLKDKKVKARFRRVGIDCYDEEHVFINYKIIDYDNKEGNFGSTRTYEKTLDELEFADGTPFGIKVN